MAQSTGQAMRFQLSPLLPAAVDGLSRVWHFDLSEQNQKIYENMKAKFESQVAHMRKTDDAQEQLTRRMSDLEKLRTKDRAQIQALQAEMKAITDHFDAIIRRLKNQVDELERRLSDLNKGYTKDQGQTEVLHAEIKAAKDSFDAILTDLKKQAEENEHLKRRLETLEGEQQEDTEAIAASQTLQDSSKAYAQPVHPPGVPEQQPVRQITQSTNLIEPNGKVAITASSSVNSRTNPVPLNIDSIPNQPVLHAPDPAIPKQLHRTHPLSGQSHILRSPSRQSIQNQGRNTGVSAAPSTALSDTSNIVDSAPEIDLPDDPNASSQPPSRNLRSRNKNNAASADPKLTNGNVGGAALTDATVVVAPKRDRQFAAIVEESSKPATKRARLAKDKPGQSSRNVPLPPRLRFIQGDSTNRQYVAMVTDHATSLGENRKEIEAFIADFIRGLANDDERKRLQVKLRERHPTRTHPQGYLVVERCKWSQLIAALKIVKII